MPYDFQTPVSLQSLDLGNAYAPDGREFQLTALMPLNILAPGTPTTTDPGQGGGQGGYQSPAAAAAASGIGSNIGTDWLTSHLPQHFGARIIFTVIAIALIIVVAFRLLK
jgi:hypothetical protein